MVYIKNADGYDYNNFEYTRTQIPTRNTVDTVYAVIYA